MPLRYAKCYPHSERVCLKDLDGKPLKLKRGSPACEMQHHVHIFIEEYRPRDVVLDERETILVKKI